MARTRKSIQPLNLNKYDVLIEDRGPRSDYFKISQFDGYFYGGRNAFLIAGASVLRPNSKILIEILSVDGTLVYSTPISEFIEGNSRLVQVEVYSDTPIGAGKIVILGCTDTYLDGTTVPEEWKNKYNVRWISDVTISPLVQNKTPIRFLKKPSATVQEKFYVSPSSSTFTEKVSVPVDIQLTQKFYNISHTGYQIKLLGPTGTKFSSNYLNGIITGSFFIAPADIETFPPTIEFSKGEIATVTLPVTKIFNSELAESQGGLIRTNTNRVIKEIFLSSSGLYTCNTPYYGGSAITGSIALQYSKLETFNTASNISYAKLRISDTKTLSGEINKVRVSYKVASEPGEYVTLSDINVGVQELLIVDSASRAAETGKFNQIVINDYWYTATMSVQKNEQPSTLPVYYNSSSLVTGTTISTAPCCQNFLDAIDVTPTIVNNKFINNTSYFIGNKTINSVELFPGSEYTLKFDAFVSRRSGSVSLEQSDYSLEIYLVEQENSSTKILEKNILGQLIGTLTPTVDFLKQNFEKVEFNFVPKIIKPANFGLRFIVYGGFWNIANISLKPAEEPYFSPDEIEILIPNINYENKILSYKIQYLDINNNSSDVETLSIPTYFTGSETAALILVPSASFAVTSSYILHQNAGNNRVITSLGSGSLTGETNLQFDGSTLSVTGSLNVSGSSTLRNVGPAQFTGSVDISGSTAIAGNLTVAGLLTAFSQSITYVSSSQLNVGTNIFTLNIQNPISRFGGIAINDSGSLPQRSGSLLFDSQNDQWIFVHQGQTTTTSSVLLMGPQTYNNVGSETNLTNNYLLKSINAEHIGDSQIFDNGTNVGIGTASPSYKLDVVGVGSNTVAVRLTPDHGKVRLYGYDLLGYNGGNLWLLSNSSVNQLTLGTGWDWDTSCDLHYTPGTTGAGGGVLIIGQTNKNSATWTHGVTDLRTNGTSRLYINSSGNVGIGTTNPTNKLHIEATDVGIRLQENGTSATWRGRIGSFNSSADRASFLGVFGGVAGVFVHNHALSAWADLYVNTVDGAGGGTVRMPSSVLINGSQALHAGNYNSYAPTLTGTGASGTWAINITGTAGNITAYTINQNLGTGNAPTFAGLNSNGNISFDATSGRSITWGVNSDGAVIKFISTGDATGQSYLEIGTIDNADEPIVFTQNGITRVKIATDGLLKNGSDVQYVLNTGTWGINITGNAATATSAGSVDFNNLTNKASGTGTYTTTGDFRAPQFIDSVDNFWYLDPNSVSQLWSVQARNLGGANLNIVSTNIGINAVREAVTFIDGTTVQAHASTGTGNAAQCYNWYSSENMQVDPEKDYEFSVWVRSTGADQIYFGWHEYNTAGTTISNNPYFHAAARNTNDTWYQIRAILRNWRTPAGAGDTEGTDRFATTTAESAHGYSTDGVMHSTTRKVLVRLGTCYGSVNGSKTYFHGLRVREIDHDNMSNQFTVPYHNGSSLQGRMRWRTNTHWDNVSGIDIIGAAGEFRMSSDTGTLTLRVDGPIITHDYIRSDYYGDNGGTFLFRAGTGSGTTRHINLANSISDPSQVGSDTGITAGQRGDGVPYYMIYVKSPYSNGLSTHSRLVLGWHTGVEIGGNAAYGGTRFMSDSPGVSTTEIMSVGKGDSNVRVTNSLLVGTTSAYNTLAVTGHLGVNGTTNSSTNNMYDAYVDGNSWYSGIPQARIRMDSSATGTIDQAPVALFIHNENGSDNTWVKLSLGGREAAGAGNTVSLAGIAARKSGGTANAWASGELHLWTKSSGAQNVGMVINSSGHARAVSKLSVGANNTDLAFGVAGSSHFAGPLYLDVGGVLGNYNTWNGRIQSTGGFTYISTNGFQVNREGYGGGAVFHINTSGAVGIGTTSIGAAIKLDVRGNISLSSDSTATIYQVFTNSGGSLYVGRENSAGSAFGIEAYANFLYTSGTYPLLFLMNGYEKMRLTNAGTLVLIQDIGSPTNYYNGLQVEIRATSGTAGIGLHRSGYSHVGIYHDSINQIKFNMNSGTVTMDATIGTVLGTGNYTSYAVAKSEFYTSTGFAAIVGKRRLRINSSDGTSLNSSITNPECGFTYGGSGEPTGPFIAFGGLNGNIDYSCQLVGAYSGGGNEFKIRTRNDDAATWNAWRTILTDGNYSSYSLPLTGGTVTGATYFLANRNTTSDSPPLQAFSNDGGGAIMSFHRAGLYAVNMGLDSDNVFRIGGWSAGANRLQMDMSGNLTMAGNVTAYSDIRLKNNIETIVDGLDKVLRLRGVSFTRNDQEDTTRTHIGVIAQEIEEIIPEVVFEDASGIKNVAYGNIIGLLIEAIKEQQTQIQQLKSQIE